MASAPFCKAETEVQWETPFYSRAWNLRHPQAWQSKQIGLKCFSHTWGAKTIESFGQQIVKVFKIFFCSAFIYPYPNFLGTSVVLNIFFIYHQLKTTKASKSTWRTTCSELECRVPSLERLKFWLLRCVLWCGKLRWTQFRLAASWPIPLGT